MAKKKSVDTMSADELFALAQERAQQEEEAKKAAVREELEALRAKRRDMIARHKKALAAVDAKIRKLGGRTGGGRRRSTGGGKVTDAVLEVLTKGKATTQEIKGALEAAGVTANNLGQTLAYLKRTGRVKSPARATYQLVK